MVLEIDDVIKQVNFGDDRLKGLGVAGGQILAFQIDFDCRPYNTLALPCECVISSRSDKGFRFCACAISRVKLFTRLFLSLIHI